MVVMVVVAVVGIGVVVGASGWEDKHVTNTRGRRQMSPTKAIRAKKKSETRWQRRSTDDQRPAVGEPRVGGGGLDKLTETTH